MLLLSQTVTSTERWKNSGTSPVIMMQATQNGEREDLASCVICWHWSSWRFWHLLPDALMRSGSVEIVRIGGEHPMELLLLQDEQMIKTLAPHAAQKALADGIGSGSVRGCVENLNRTHCRHTSETGPKFPIVITDQILRACPNGVASRSGTRHPGIAGRSRDADMDHSS
jgi:hypothetical protein